MESDKSEVICPSGDSVDDGIEVDEAGMDGDS